MKKLKKKKSIDVQRWAIRFCALAMASGLYLVARPDEQNKKGITVITCTSAILGGIGMAYHKFTNKERN